MRLRGTVIGALNLFHINHARNHNRRLVDVARHVVEGILAASTRRSILTRRTTGEGRPVQAGDHAQARRCRGQRKQRACAGCYIAASASQKNGNTNAAKPAATNDTLRCW